jgi:hypothetical protein
MHRRGGDRWEITIDWQQPVNFVVWVRRRVGRPLPFAAALWTVWLRAVVARHVAWRGSGTQYRSHERARRARGWQPEGGRIAQYAGTRR